MKSNVKTKLLIALAFLLIVAIAITAFFVGRRGNGEIRSAYDYNTTATTVSSEKKSKKTSEKPDNKQTTKKGQKQITIPGQYVSILDKYQDALTYKRNEAALRQSGLSTLLPELYEGEALSNVGFYVDDYNGDGTTDLLIGVVDGYEHFPYAILDYYTLDNNGKAYNVFQSQPKDYFTAVTKARFLEKATDGKNYTAWYLYGLNSNGMAFHLEEGLIRDKDANKKDPWYKTTDLDGEVKNDTHLKTDAGKKRQKQIDDARVQFDFTTFQQYSKARRAG